MCMCMCVLVCAHTHTRVFSFYLPILCINLIFSRDNSPRNFGRGGQSRNLTKSRNEEEACLRRTQFLSVYVVSSGIKIPRMLKMWLWTPLGVRLSTKTASLLNTSDQNATYMYVRIIYVCTTCMYIYKYMYMYKYNVHNTYRYIYLYIYIVNFF